MLIFCPLIVKSPAPSYIGVCVCVYVCVSLLVLMCILNYICRPNPVFQFSALALLIQEQSILDSFRTWWELSGGFKLNFKFPSSLLDWRSVEWPRISTDQKQVNSHRHPTVQVMYADTAFRDLSIQLWKFGKKGKKKRHFSATVAKNPWLTFFIILKVFIEDWFFLSPLSPPTHRYPPQPYCSLQSKNI